MMQTNQESFDLFRPFIRVIALTFFTGIEYLRSWRIGGDILATIGFCYLFFVADWGGVLDVPHFFSFTSIFLFIISLYTMSATLSLADRPQSYLLLSRKLGRAGYLMGLYLHASMMIFASYLFISLWGWLFGGVDLHVIDWLIGSLPLLLNTLLFLALLLLLSPLVFSTGWRLFVLSLFALAFSGSFFTGTAQNPFPQWLQSVLQGLQTLLSFPLVPAFSGFALAIEHEVSLYAAIVIVAQFSLLVALLGLAFFAFSRRELMFGIE
jgi:hypothetical protein